MVKCVPTSYHTLPRLSSLYCTACPEKSFREPRIASENAGSMVPGTLPFSRFLYLTFRTKYATLRALCIPLNII